MTVAARQIDPDAWTKERFLSWAETRPDDRSYEFDGVRPVAMAPATLGHNEIARNIRETIRGLLPAGSGCKAYGPLQPIETVGGALREPDVFISCAAPNRKAVTIAAPIVVFEVLSPGRENRRRDEEEKVDEYESVPTILRYIIVESESRGVRVFWRQPGEREWRLDPVDEAGPVSVPEFGIKLDFNEIYEGVAFD
jgi:Uma2 family endonuclease